MTDEGFNQRLDFCRPLWAFVSDGYQRQQGFICQSITFPMWLLMMFLHSRGMKGTLFLRPSLAPLTLFIIHSRCFAAVTSRHVAIFQDIRPRQSSLRVAAGKNRLQVHLQQEVHGGRLSDLASPQPGKLHAATHTERQLCMSVLTFLALIEIVCFVVFF